MLGTLSNQIKCECPRHKKHVKDFIKKNPGADGIFGIVGVEPGEWLINLEHPEKNTAHCCQLRCVLEDTIRVTSPEWNENKIFLDLSIEVIPQC